MINIIKKWFKREGGVGSFISQRSNQTNTFNEVEAGTLVNNNFQSHAILPQSDTLEAIEAMNGTFQPFPLTAVSLEIVSTSTDDTILGSGAQKVVVNGLDASRNPQTEIIEMDGTTPVAIPGTWLRVNKTILPDDGSDAFSNNLGTITTQVSGGGDFMSQIEPLTGQSFTPAFSTNSSQGTRIYRIDVEAGRVGDTGQVAFFRATDEGPLVMRTAPLLFNGNNFERDFPGPIEVPANSDTLLKAAVDNDKTMLTVTAQLINSTI